MTDDTDNKDECLLYECFMEGMPEKFRCDVSGCPWYRMCPIRMMEYILFMESKIEDCKKVWKKGGQRQEGEFNNITLQTLFDEWYKENREELKTEIIKRMLSSIKKEKLLELIKEQGIELESIDNGDYERI